MQLLKGKPVIRKNMSKISVMVVFKILFLTGTSIYGQPNAKHTFRSKLEKINSVLSVAFRNENAAIIAGYYTVEAACMPEYHKAVFKRADIERYFQKWFEATGSNTYSRVIYDVEKTGHYLIELGTFYNNFLKACNDSFRYQGKYIRIWKIGKNKALAIVLDIWGTDDYLDRGKFPFIEDFGSEPIPVFTVAMAIREEIRKRNAAIRDLVVSRNGEKHSAFFTSDAIYMPYYKPMLIGFDSVKSYFIEHEKPGDVYIDSLKINTNKIIDAGTIVFEQGYYGVKWRTMDSKNEGVVTGKSINIWKRNKKAVLMLYRQMVNHD
jgi:ketosteroid isomerase-like protein